MTQVFAAAQELQAFFEARGWCFCFIGGIALLRWGEPRATVDVDVTLLTGFGDEGRYVREMLSHFRVRREDAEQFALANRVLLLLAGNGTGVDVALGGIPLEEQAVARASPFEFAPGVTLLTCSAEDLVVYKAFSSRTRDWLDLEGVIVRQGDALDWGYVERELVPLCEAKEEPEIPSELRRLRQTLSEEREGENG